MEGNKNRLSEATPLQGNYFELLQNFMQAHNISGSLNNVPTAAREESQIASAQDNDDSMTEEDLELLASFKTQIEQMTDQLIELSASKIDKLEDSIEQNIDSKIRTKIREEIIEKERGAIQEVFQQEMVSKDELKKLVVGSMETDFKEYFQKVAGIYDLGLKHFRDYCKEAESISKVNKEKIQQIHAEIAALRSDERNIIKELQSQAQDELEEIKAMKEITETQQKCQNKLTQINERNVQLQQYLSHLQMRLYQKEVANASLIDNIVKDTLASMIEDDDEREDLSSQKQIDYSLSNMLMNLGQPGKNEPSPNHYSQYFLQQAQQPVTKQQKQVKILNKEYNQNLPQQQKEEYYQNDMNEFDDLETNSDR